MSSDRLLRQLLELHLAHEMIQRLRDLNDDGDDTNEPDNLPKKLFKLIGKNDHELSPGFQIPDSRVDKVRELIKQPEIRDNIDVADSKGHTALFLAIQSRQHKIARPLLEETSADVFHLGDIVRSPLLLACMGTKKAIGGTTLMFLQWLLPFLAQRGQGDLIKQCLNAPRVGNVILTALCAKKHEQPLLLELLLEYGADPNYDV